MRIIISAYTFLFILGFLCATSQAASEFPASCTEGSFKVEGKTVILYPDPLNVQALYLFHNNSDNKIIINHPVADPGASAGWASELDPGNWSAFTIAKGKFAITCTEANGENYKEVPCEKTLGICKFNDPEFKQANEGSYWVSENKTRIEVLAEILARGIKY